MGTKKYVVRDGFVVVQQIPKTEGGFNERRYESGEEVALEDADYALHAHKLEFASQKDRDAALAAEKADAIAKKADMHPADLIAGLTAALVQAMTNAGVQAPAQAAATA